jgi:hypothetical protein
MLDSSIRCGRAGRTSTEYDEIEMLVQIGHARPFRARAPCRREGSLHWLLSAYMLVPFTENA